MSGASFTDEQKQEIKEIVQLALVEFFKGYGITGKNTIVTIAVLIGSLTVIFGGLKWLLGAIGFAYLTK